MRLIYLTIVLCLILVACRTENPLRLSSEPIPTEHNAVRNYLGWEKSGKPLNKLAVVEVTFARINSGRETNQEIRRLALLEVKNNPDNLKTYLSTLKEEFNCER
jgi:hypothetical protein